MNWTHQSVYSLLGCAGVAEISNQISALTGIASQTSQLAVEHTNHYTTAHPQD